MHIRTRSTALSLGLAVLAACGGDSTTGLANLDSSFTIQSCSLGCSDGSQGLITCGILNVHVNEQIVIEFSAPVDFSTVKKTSFKLKNIVSGTSPVGEFIAGDTPNQVIFRPLIAFSPTGAPIFGFQANSTYELLIPGVLQSSGPYIKSTSGAANFVQMNCFLQTSQGILDTVPGPPTVDVLVDVCNGNDPLTGDCTDVELDVSANSGTVLTDVWRDSNIRMVFDDIMNPSTLMNPTTGTSDFITIVVDPDGDVGDSTDQVPLFGVFSILLNYTNLTTTVLFTPSTGMPSAGEDPLNPRRVVVKFSPQIADLGGNPLANGANVQFVPEVIDFSSTILPDGTGENFSTTTYEDAPHSASGMWGPGGLPFLGAGETGGSGRLGELLVRAGETLTLGSDGSVDMVQQVWGVGDDSATEVFTQSFILDNYDPGLGQLPGTGLYSADDGFVGGAGATGVFEFSRIEVQSGSRLEIVGDAAARLLARGTIEIGGTLDISGFAPDNHPSNEALGSLGGVGGPGAGDGGTGGDRFDYAGTEYLPVSSGGLLLDPNLAGIDNPLFVSLDGTSGEGVGGSSEGAGGGGLHWPTSFPGHDDALGTAFTGLLTDLGGFEADQINCRSPQLGAPGGGGAYGLDGNAGQAQQVGSSNPPVPANGPNSPGGSAGDVTVGDLDPETGDLRGGSGGGGAGTHILSTKVNGVINDCSTPDAGVLAVTEFTDHSGAGGGGGGGAAQVQGGRAVSILGSVNASGGRGGSADANLPIYARSAQSGGGGSGGALLVQSPSIAVNTVPGRINLLGGPGGQGPGFNFGGSGGAGVVRFELTPDSDEDLQALVDSVVDNDLTLPGNVPSIVFSGSYSQPDLGPSPMTGAQSCWMAPDDSNYFQVDYAADVVDSGTGYITQPGWDMDVLFAGGTVAVSYRTTFQVGPQAGQSIQDILGNVLREPNEVPILGVTAPVVVRFQGVRSIAPITDPCAVDLSASSTQVLPESLTPWVYHPVELTGTGAADGYWDLVAMTGAITASQAAQRRPNMIRYQIVFDQANGYEGFISGVTNLYIGVTPE